MLAEDDYLNDQIELPNPSDSQQWFFIADGPIEQHTPIAADFPKYPESEYQQVIYTYERWDSTQWRNTYRRTYTYNSRGKCLRDQAEQWDSTGWVYSFYERYTYAGDTTLIGALRCYWDIYQWMVYDSCTFTYESGGYWNEMLKLIWEGDQWSNYSKDTCTYDVNGNRIQWLQQEWDGTGWVNFRKDSTVYDSSGYLIENHGQHWIIAYNQWMNGKQNIYFYNELGQQTERIEKKWSDDGWNNLGRFTYSYDDQGRMIDRMGYNWGRVSSEWIISGCRSYTYDLSGLLQEELDQLWTEASWENLKRYIFAYSAHDDLIERLLQFWIGNEWINYDRLAIAYFPTLNLDQRGQLPALVALHLAYPNPFNPYTTIRYELPQSSEVLLIVYDLLGREVARLVDGYLEPGYHEVQWNGRDFASGIYIARLVTPGYTESIKMVLLR
jgi:hypothetical protein